MKRLPIVIAVIALVAGVKFISERPSKPPTPTATTDKPATPNTDSALKPPASKGNEKELSDGLKYEDFEPGKGDAVKSGSTVSVHYTGWLIDGSKFDSSLDRGQPFDVNVGAGGVIKGWDLGLVGMKAGGKRKLIIPPHLGYGEGGQGQIPANATLIFLIECLEIRK